MANFAVKRNFDENDVFILKSLKNAKFSSRFVTFERDRVETKGEILASSFLFCEATKWANSYCKPTHKSVSRSEIWDFLI